MTIYEDDIVAVGGELEARRLMTAYRNGIFPWPIEGLPLTWFCPMERAIVRFDALHIPRSLERMRRKLPLTFTVDKNFDEVIQYCADLPRPGQQGTWITPEMLRVYRDLHREGFAHSIEAWENGTLVGGVYGIDASGYFSAESMFHLRPYASKLALLYLFDYLKARGLNWIDIQMMTPHMQALGAQLISRNEFLRLMVQTQDENREKGLKLFG
jgi:leucyl/phenylalanyl-tRNA--protein transferase